MQMQGADNEGLTGFMNKAAVAFGDEELETMSRIISRYVMHCGIRR